MGNFLEKASATLVSVTIPGPDAAVERILFNAQNFSMRSNGVLLMVQEPNEEERRLLLKRQVLLAKSMEHDRHMVKVIIGQMLAGFSQPIKANETAEQVVALFVHELGLDPAVPTWAISQACSAIRNGSVPEARERPRPSTMAVRRLADSYVWKARTEISVISDVLKGRRAFPQVSPAERAKIGKRFRAVADAMIARQKAREVLDTTADVEKLKAILAASGRDAEEAFNAVPDAQGRSPRGSIGLEAQKAVAGGRR